MHFKKYAYPPNFEFGDLRPGRIFQSARGSCRLDVREGDGDIYHLRITGPAWRVNDSDAELRMPRRAKTGASTTMRFDDGALRLVDHEGKDLLASLPARMFGRCGEASMFEFLRRPGDQFYGMGEKWTGFEHSGRTTKFWNTDVWEDFHSESYMHCRPAPDPVYVSIPYLILKRGNVFLGLLLDNPRATFISTGFRTAIHEELEVNPAGGEFAEAALQDTPRGRFHIGAEEGQPSLYIIYGPSLSELTRKLQNLVGTTPRPPAWALGYHQCRYGYQSEADLTELDTQFRRHDFPVDGLWLDIDYMRGYRVFTFAKEHFPNPRAAIARLAKHGRRVIPIIDPGVKREPGYGVYDRGRAADAFCLNSQGREYIGLVWPGETAFPDFSADTARAWWADEVKQFAGLGIPGAWLDMNDPSTGPSDNKEMLFDRGRKPHSSYHNQYALGMAKATRQGFLEAHPGQRPFLLCRSGSTGINRYTAVWTGDNSSNYHHLRACIGTTLNLALSGVPFNGPDAGGFGGDATAPLIRDWYKAGFLFPVLRNHSMKGTRRQEPWTFDRATLRVLRHYVQLRYRFRPYLYQLFIEHERTGDAILRPLFYDFADTAKLPLGKIDDQFLVGPHILQAPFVEEGAKNRKVVLPDGTRWFDLSTSKWLSGGRKITVAAHPLQTPIYVRDRTILPLARIAPSDHAFDAARVDFHVFLKGNGEAHVRYVIDDGQSFRYREGKQSELEIHARRMGATLELSTQRVSKAAGEAGFTVSAEASISRVVIDGRAARRVKSQGLPIASSPFSSWVAAA